tara:strand:+ start:567 stop:1211 length:645 start_codon:yes stop_codon:yes gene_type:complete
MDEDINIINSNTRNAKIKNFLIENKKSIILSIFLIFFLLVFFFSFTEYKKSQKIKISDKYNSITSSYSKNNEEITKKGLLDLIAKKDKTYSPLSLYFIIDNELISNQSKINELFDVLIEDISLEEEIKNLVIYKKALFNADKSDENQLLEILKPLMNSNSVWNAHGLNLMAEYFYSKKEKLKAKEFFNKIIVLENASQELKIEAQKRLNRDLSD